MVSVEQILNTIKFIVAAVGVLIILWGTIWTIWQVILGKLKSTGIDHIRLNFGRMIVLGLEFIVAADVIATTLSPDYYNLGILASLVLVRTFLTYFINREINHIAKREK